MTSVQMVIAYQSQCYVSALRWVLWSEHGPHDQVKFQLLVFLLMILIVINGIPDALAAIIVLASTPAPVILIISVVMAGFPKWIMIKRFPSESRRAFYILVVTRPQLGPFFVLKFVRSRGFGARFLQPLPKLLVTVTHFSNTKMAVNSR